jgi:hypothetical protein
MYTQQWYISYRFVDSFEQYQDGTAVPSWSCSKAVKLEHLVRFITKKKRICFDN